MIRGNSEKKSDFPKAVFLFGGERSCYKELRAP